MHSGLAAKLPDIKSLSGHCLDGTDVSLNIDTTSEGSFQATLYTPDNMLYADTIANDTYMVYLHVDALSKESTQSVTMRRTSTFQVSRAEFP